jgi:mono/diheme cytochrome c family protein
MSTPRDPRRAARASIALLAGLTLAMSAGAQTSAAQTPASIERGRYLVRTAGCNDCHTPGYPESGGKVDEKLWLVGSPVGWRGPWGTTYPANLRLVAQGLTEKQWLAHARNEWRPPMPWFALRDMTDADVTAIYRYLRFLGPAGTAAPSFVAPEREPAPPFVSFPAAPPK